MIFFQNFSYFIPSWANIFFLFIFWIKVFIILVWIWLMKRILKNNFRWIKFEFCKILVLITKFIIIELLVKFRSTKWIRNIKTRILIFIIHFISYQSFCIFVICFFFKVWKYFIVVLSIFFILLLYLSINSCI